MIIFLTDSVAGVAVRPVEYQPAPGVQRRIHRTKGGRERVYDWGSWDGFAAGVDFVSSSDTYQLNDWWRLGTPLWATVDSATPYQGRLANTTTPLPARRWLSETYQGSLLFGAL